jgi:uncharacterized protein YeaO (DUF488 family)
MASRRKTVAGTLRVKRVYDAPAAEDGLRVLVDRLWPRGISKDKAGIDLWLKDIAPSDALRHRLHEDPSSWPAFVTGYAAELTRLPADDAVAQLRQHAARGAVTLLYAARDEAHNNAVALKAWLEKHKSRQRRPVRQQRATPG